MAKNKTYIILYSDGTLGIFNSKQKTTCVGVRQFECDDNLPIIELCEWQGKNFKHSKIKELDFKII